MAASTVRASLPEWDSFFPAEPVGSPCSYRKVQGGLPGVVFCSHVMPFCKGQEFFHNTHSRLVISAQGAYLARPLGKDFIHGVMEPSRNACQPSTVYSRFTGRRPPFTLQPGLATTFIHFLCHSRISVRSLCHSHGSSGLTVCGTGTQSQGSH